LITKTTFSGWGSVSGSWCPRAEPLPAPGGLNPEGPKNGRKASNQIKTKNNTNKTNQPTNRSIIRSIKAYNEKQKQNGNRTNERK